MVFTHEYRCQVRAEQVDSYGHVNNAQYLQMFELARWEWIGPWGGNKALAEELGVGPIVIEITVRFLKELKLGDNLVVKSKREGHLGRIFRIDHEIIDPSGECACRANFRMGFMNLNTRRLVEPPHLWREIFNGRTIDTPEVRTKA